MLHMSRVLLCAIVMSSLVVQAQEVPVTGKEIQDNWVGKMLSGTKSIAPNCCGSSSRRRSSPKLGLA